MSSFREGSARGTFCIVPVNNFKSGLQTGTYADEKNALSRPETLSILNPEMAGNSFPCLLRLPGTAGNSFPNGFLVPKIVRK
jgi:hypothetical protein